MIGNIVQLTTEPTPPRRPVKRPPRPNLLGDANDLIAQMPAVEQRRMTRFLGEDSSRAIVLLFKDGTSMQALSLRYQLSLAQVEDVIRQFL